MPTGARTLPAEPKVAVVGASGAVGRVMLDVLAERGFPAAEVRAIATERSAGRPLAFGDQTLLVEAISEDALKGADLVLVDTPDEAALEWAPVALRAGAVVVDNSAAFRMEDEVPLVVPEINPQAVGGHSGIVASPNCTTIGIVLPLFALHRRFGVRKVVVSSYQAVSGAGQAGVEELREQALKAAAEIDLLAAGEWVGPDPKIFPEPIAFNVVPQDGSPREGGYTGEEWKVREESRKIMGLPTLDMTATCVRVPTVVGHGAAVFARFEQEVDLGVALRALGEMPGVEVVDLPTPLAAAGRDACLVGRVRRDLDDPRALWFFSVQDNLRKGAALNAVQIAELLLPR